MVLLLQRVLTPWYLSVSRDNANLNHLVQFQKRNYSFFFFGGGGVFCFYTKKMGNLQLLLSELPAFFREGHCIILELFNRV